MRSPPFRYVECRACELVQIEPIPSLDVLNDYYSTRTYQDGLPEGARAERATDRYGPILDVVRALAPHPSTLLEVGCSTGHFLGRLADAGHDVYGVDFSASAIRTARERFGARVASGMVQDASAPRGKVDGVILLATVEHLLDPVADLTAARELLRPGGWILLTTGQVDSPEERAWSRLHPRRARARPPCWYSAPEHITCFSQRTIASTLRRAGFQDVRTMTGYGDPRGSTKALVRQGREAGRALAKSLAAFALPRIERSDLEMTALAWSKG